ncbi:MAG: YidC/Oxa1 family membrane protein insertase [Actinobacteria bacterium]|nr:MAG: YidC/Oxa1 family membrane protein insertase [Actinomycetota bacterium]
MNPFDALFKGLAGLIAFYYGLIPNYTVAISLLTITVMVVLAPLTWKSTRSMISMQALQPEIKKLQQKHKNDRQKLNEETMALYREHQVNPVTSCLPTFLQLPVFFIMFAVLRGLTHAPKGSAAGFDPKYISHASKLYKSLVHQHHMRAFGINLEDSASKALSKHGVATALPFLVIAVLVFVTQWYNQRQMTGRNPQTAQANPQAQMMTKIMPLLFGVWAFIFSAGLNVYFLVSTLFRIAQQDLMYRLDPALAATAGMTKQPRPAPPKRPSQDSGRGPRAGGGAGDSGAPPRSTGTGDTTGASPRSGGGNGAGRGPGTPPTGNGSRDGARGRGRSGRRRSKRGR